MDYTELVKLRDRLSNDIEEIMNYGSRSARFMEKKEKAIKTAKVLIATIEELK